MSVDHPRMNLGWSGDTWDSWDIRIVVYGHMCVNEPGMV